MADDNVTIWNSGLKLGRKPANGELLIGDNVGFKLATLAAGSGVTISNTAGGISIAATGSGGTVTSVTATSPLSSSGGATPDISLSGTVAVNRGGTGAATLALNNVILGNGTSAVQTVAPGTSGNLLTSNGTTWGSSAPAWTVSFKTSNQSVTSSTAFVDVTQLSFAVTSGTYTFDFIIPVTAGAGGIKLAVNGPTLTSLYAALSNNPASISAYDTAIITLAGAGTLVVRIHGVVTVSASGTFTLRFGQASSNAATSSVLAGSIVQYGRMP
jgi:hypothetical protein